MMKILFAGGIIAATIYVYIKAKQLKEELMADFTELKDAITEMENVGDAVVEMLNGIAMQLDEALADEVDQAEIAALATQVRAQAQEFADAITTHTPVEDVPDEPDVVEVPNDVEDDIPDVPSEGEEDGSGGSVPES